MSLEQRIASAAVQNKALLQTLSETDHAGPALAQQQRLVADLRTSLADSDRRVQYMAQRRLKEFREHEKYRDSVLRRFAYKATGRGGRFAERAAKEEKEYFAALQVEQQDQAMNREIRAQLDDASRVADELQALAAKHDAAQQELDKLYEGIFGGETPGMPEEDEKERVVAVVRGQYHSAREKAEAEAVAVRLLGDAQRRMRGAMASMDEALSASRFDMFSSGAFADVMERNALHRAQTEVMAARMSVVQAQRMSPLVPPPPIDPLLVIQSPEILLAAGQARSGSVRGEESDARIAARSAAEMLAVFDQAVAPSPEGLRQPGAAGEGSAAKLADRFSEARPDAVTVNLGSSGAMAYSSHGQSPLLPRLFGAVDDIFCLLQGTIENVAILKQQYGLSKGANEVNIVIEAYRTLRDRGPYPADQVVRDINGKFSFVLYDCSTKSVFMAADADGNIPFYWGVDSDGRLVVSDDDEMVKKACGKSSAPFPKGFFFTTSGGLRSYEHPMNEVKPVPRVNSKGEVCGTTYTVDAKAKKDSSSIPRVGSAADWSSQY